ncbi:diaminopimelate epimerase [Micromonospora carbonacea]|uniref:Diaminopimelate epimerase n=1 Tax=Micromonospora carbonacea TaxID=47853 RepID=A0A7H8XGZ2_9ACTN|nr:diaminopimelate epimerase [Micromonospora carbonacea]MBB5827975.1 diaminopimelate epimerase [Micromonospora carbonacea]QLD24343.1 diaminopimelate epimerase [Micromonospora carbonacea]
MEFTKGHGTGNDFVILPDPDGALDLTPGLVAALCDRRRGLGADGVLRVVRAAKHPEGAGRAGEAEWFMDYWNADGSFAEMCGNGARVFVRYLLAQELAEPVDGAVPVVTRAGLVRARVEGDGIAVEMRRPRLYDTSTAALGGLTLAGTAVDVGNPHLVCALPAGLDLGALDLTRAPAVDPALFPAGVNVEFTVPGDPVDGVDGHVLMRVHERGSAETLSCGTGACAVAAVALRDAGRDAGTVTVDVPGGRLTVTVTDDACWLAGPALLIATGAVDPAALRR